MTSTWNITEPADDAKIRLLGQLIRPNWAAIDTADPSFQPNAINFTNRSQESLDIPDDPTSIAETYILYAKTSITENIDLYGISSSGIITQFTNGTTPVLNATSGQCFLSGGLTMMWGQVSSSSWPVTVSFNGGGFRNTCLCAQVSPLSGGAAYGVWISSAFTKESMVVSKVLLGGSASFSYIAIGY